MHIEISGRFASSRVGGCRNRAIRRALAVGAAAVVTLVSAGGAVHAAPKLKTLYSFPGMKGIYPGAGLTADAAGNLFGTTRAGGADGLGVVFQLSPLPGGGKGWAEKVLHTFNGTDGDTPYSGLIADAAGDLYGTTKGGGPTGDGVVFELKPPKGSHKDWTYGVLYAFSFAHGYAPLSSLVADGAGNLYGTLSEGGGHTSRGGVFELSPPAQGQTAWTETLLYPFRSGGEDPVGNLITDAAGNLYGTTVAGGANLNGAVFELSPPAAGQTAWTETVLYSFGGRDGSAPEAGLIADAAGDLYGTTVLGGANGDGVVFELSPPAQGQTTWTEAVLHSFGGPDGSSPLAGLLADAAGNLYGTTNSGGASGQGVTFEVSPPVAGQTTWTEKVLASFDGTNGAGPVAGLISDGAGGFYGTAEGGGRSDYGVAFELKR